MKTLNYPNSTETMAERAWRYGEQGVPHSSKGGGFLWFADDSAMGHWEVETRRSVQAVRDRVDDILAGRKVRATGRKVRATGRMDVGATGRSPLRTE
jgi:hypothetical protein